MLRLCMTVFAGLLLFGVPASAAEPADPLVELNAYFGQQTAAVRDACLADISSREDWEAQRPELKRQLLEMLGLDPLPEKSDLQATVTGTAERDDFVVEKIHFQSLPHLYVTANLYLPKEIAKPLPAILYVCGHGAVRKGNVSYGNKVHYHHHGAWFARNGYACLAIDSVELGEIEGVHHGTYDREMWWWLCRGYTPAGVEAWNCLRAIDYLQSRAEIDPQKIGVTGRSGGGAYSWWIAAIDERIAAAVPVAGITDLQNHVVDGCVEGHCDCMYFVNTYRWDYPLVAALVAPRPLLISNTDRDSIFPLDGVVRTHRLTKRIYENIYQQPDPLALNICAGEHKDTQELQVNAFRWLNRHLKGDEALIEKTAVPYFTPEELKVFAQLPTDSINAQIAESFVPAAAALAIPTGHEQWSEWKRQWLDNLASKTFRGWPGNWTGNGAYEIRPSDAAADPLLGNERYQLTTQPHVVLPLYLHREAGAPVQHVVVLDDQTWREWKLSSVEQGPPPLLPSDASAVIIPRGTGPIRWAVEQPKLTQLRRRFYLLGQTLEGMQVWDVRQALAALRAQGHDRLIVHARGAMAGVTLYASLWSEGIAELHLHSPPHSHRDGPILLNVQRFMDVPQAMALAAERTRVVVYDDQPDAWQAVAAVRDQLGWPANQFEVLSPSAANTTSPTPPNTP